ncbi:uncharacterized protein BJX67DRAFT_364422 [Aspergillus lucknowensis]|uniref:Uncharacterized protein n=1 Tax=Aspergillus lucknowensis TaxID=176173 RepID=A0ABR4LFG7_9EURO
MTIVVTSLSFHHYRRLQCNILLWWLRWTFPTPLAPGILNLLLEPEEFRWSWFVMVWG